MATPHSVNNYTISKGVLSIAAWSGDSIGTYHDVGNCPSMEIEPTIERLPHYSSRSGARVKDKNPVISTEYTVRFDLDEIAAENLAKFLLGSITGNNLIYALQDTDNEYALRFVENNPAGPNKTWNLWKVALSPGGPLQLIGDGTAWAVMSLQGEGLADTKNHSTSPYITVTYATTTTTTSTTTTS